jgi:hypothetical protein
MIEVATALSREQEEYLRELDIELEQSTAADAELGSHTEGAHIDCDCHRAGNFVDVDHHDHHDHPGELIVETGASHAEINACESGNCGHKEHHHVDEVDRHHVEDKHITGKESHDHHEHKKGHEDDCHCATCTPEAAKNKIDRGNCAEGNCGHEHHHHAKEKVDDAHVAKHDHAHGAHKNEAAQTQAHKHEDHAAVSREVHYSSHHDTEADSIKYSTINEQADQHDVGRRRQQIADHSFEHHASESPEAEETVTRHFVIDNESAQALHEAETVRHTADVQPPVEQEQKEASTQAEQETPRTLEPEQALRLEVHEVMAQEQASETVDLTYVTADESSFADNATEQKEGPSTVHDFTDTQSELLPFAPLESNDENNTTMPDEAGMNDNVDLSAKIIPELYEAAATHAAADAIEHLPASVLIDAGEQEIVQRTEIGVDQQLAPPVIVLPKVPSEALSSPDELLSVFEAIEEQFKTFEESPGNSNSRREALDDVRKTVTVLRASLHKNSGEANNTAVSQELLHLLSLLGFEKPEETLNMYIQRYGFNALSDLLTHLFELLHRSQAIETFALTKLPIFTPASDKHTLGIGKIIMRLLSNGQQLVSKRDLRPVLQM